MSGSAKVEARSREEGVRETSTHKFLIHNRGDHVGVAVSDIQAGEKVIGIYMDDDAQIEIIARADIPLGHKIALVDLDENQPVLKYGIRIGITTSKWKVGDYVHTHNIKSARW
ncbi:UxaA family hydrolase [Geobacillus thermodenitrificans]|uniref:UxaA family hydrolase n=1 Tax=Geobacillus thermodenitrificans TaxID=33940 RepID=UPI002E1DBCE6|nr:UxaA family hydrolase [Geobacillus thermodenitrificans]